MGTRYHYGQRGFTVIELMLVLALTGMMAAALLGGWTVMINTQRYKDSVRSTQSFIQEQYNLVYNVQNARENSFRCNNSNVVDDTSGTGELRGQSECVLMGRYIHLDNGRTMRVLAIVGEKPAIEAANSDIASIKGYDPKVTDLQLGLDRNELPIAWEAEAVTGAPGSNALMSAVIAIIRAPSSGIVHTYVDLTPNDGSRLPLDVLVDSTNEEADLPICLNPGASLSGGRMGVLIKARASSQTFIQTISDGAGIC